MARFLHSPLPLLVITSLLVGASCEKKAPEPAPSEPAPEATPAASDTAAPPPPPPAPEAEKTPTAAAAPASAAPGDVPAPADVAQAPADAKRTASGLATKVLTPGKGKERPTDTDRVKVHYSGWTKDGKMFDSSVARNEPTTFGVNQVIPGWTEALKLMVVGEKRRLWIPGKLAYGDSPRMGAPAGDLTFDVELMEILSPPKTPEDVAAAPATAKKTKSGLAYRVLTPGKGKLHPTAANTVTVHYSGWTTDGKMFDSSVSRGQPTSFSLGAVIPGWTEGVQLMVEGEKTRFWIPGNLAYGDTPKRPGAPAGMLVFDIELLGIR